MFNVVTFHIHNSSFSLFFFFTLLSKFSTILKKKILEKITLKKEDLKKNEGNLQRSTNKEHHDKL